MTFNSTLQIVVYFLVLLMLSIPLGFYMARVYEGLLPRFMFFLRPLEKGIYALSGIDSTQKMSGKHYAVCFLLFNFLGFGFLYFLLRLQSLLPFNPQALSALSPELAFNTAVSFVTNTNWQSYGGETTMSYLSQMLGLTVQNFISASVGMAVAIAFIRGFKYESQSQIGNFWTDTVRGIVYILLPLSTVFTLFLVSQGVVQTLRSSEMATLVETYQDEHGQLVKTQTLATGPVASQIAIKQLGTNGGGFFNANSAHPFENPTPLSNFLEMIVILLLPAAFCWTFGKMVLDVRQGRAIFATMTLLLVGLLGVLVVAEQQGNPLFAKLSIDQQATPEQAGGNMEGKEVRFGIANSAIWAAATTAASNGSVNAMHDSFTPIGGMIPLWLIQLGEIIFGGVGSGLYGLLSFTLVAIFIAGLMVGRTPEYLGKKIEAFEIKMVSMVILLPALAVKIGTAIGVSFEAGRRSVLNAGPHGFSEVLYAFSSAANNNGSAFAGLNANTPFYNIALGLAMLIGRYWVVVPVLAIASQLASKKKIPAGSGTLPTHKPLFVALLILVILIVGSLTFLPSLALGPIVEHLQLQDIE